MFAFVHLAQEEGWRPEGDTIATYTNPAFEQREQEGMISLSNRIVRIRQARHLKAKDLMAGIRSEDHQIKLKGTAPWINDLRIKDIFKNKNKEEGISVIDLINGLVEILRLEAKELRDVVWQAFTLVEPWDKG